MMILSLDVTITYLYDYNKDITASWANVSMYNFIVMRDFS
jgi:hypothetical protein